MMRFSPDDQIDGPMPQDERFLSLFLGHRGQIFSYIYTLVGNRADAEDVFQQASITLWRRFGEFRPDGDFLSWGMGVAFNTVRNFRRTRGRDRLRFDDELLLRIAEAQAERSGAQWDLRRDALGRCLRRLAAAEAELLSRCYSAGQSVREVAESLGRTGEAIYSQLKRVRRKLLICVEQTVAAEEARR